MIGILLFLTLISTVDTRVAVLEQRVQTICDDISEVKQTAKKNNELLNEIKQMVNPHIVELQTRLENHIGEHERAEGRFWNSRTLFVAIIGVVIVGIELWHTVRVGKNAGKST